MGGKEKKRIRGRRLMMDEAIFEDWFHGFMNTGHDARGAGATSQRLHILGLTLSTLLFLHPFSPFPSYFYHLWISTICRLNCSGTRRRMECLILVGCSFSSSFLSSRHVFFNSSPVYFFGYYFFFFRLFPFLTLSILSDSPFYSECRALSMGPPKMETFEKIAAGVTL